MSYQIGEIYPENIPFEIINAIDFDDKNLLLIKVASFNTPPKVELESIFDLALGYDQSKDRLTDYEKFDLLLHLYNNGKLSQLKFCNRVTDLQINLSTQLKGFFEFMANMNSSQWIPSDAWEWDYNILKGQMNLPNRYADYKT